MSTQRVGIVGTGQVGMAAAFAMFVQKTCSELVLLDTDKQRARGEARDLMHGQGYVGRIVVRDGDYADLADCHVVVIAAGAAQKPGESRLDLLNRNAAVFRDIAESLDRHAPGAIVVVASNPVDVLTYTMQEMSERHPRRVIGTGTMLDTSRFRTLLGQHYGVDPRSVHGYILGEHGDSEFAAWSTVTIGGKSPREGVTLGQPWDEETMERLFQAVRGVAYEIIRSKGYTNWAIGLVISQLVESILEDRRSIQPVSVRLDDDYGMSDVCLSVPARIGADGIQRLVHLRLEAAEQTALQHSAGVLRDSLTRIVM